MNSHLSLNKPPKTNQAKVVASQQRSFQRKQYTTVSEAKGGFCPLKLGVPVIVQEDLKNLTQVPKNSNLILKIHLFNEVAWVYNISVIFTSLGPKSSIASLLHCMRGALNQGGCGGRKQVFNKIFPFPPWILYF